MDTFCKESFWNDYLWRFSVMYGVVCFIVLPLSLLKNIAKLECNTEWSKKE